MCNLNKLLRLINSIAERVFVVVVVVKLNNYFPKCAGIQLVFACLFVLFFCFCF